MNKIPKCRSKYFQPSQDNNIKQTPRDSTKEHLVPKITQKNLKFSSNRQFGKDLTNSMKGNYYNIYNNNTIKVVTIDDKKSSNKVYIKKHSSASQTIQKSHKVKIETNGKKIRENKSNSILSPEYEYNRNNNNLDYPPQIESSKLQSTISFGINNIRPFSSNNNSISVRLSNPVNKMSNNINRRRIDSNNENNNNNFSNEKPNNNGKIATTHSNLDLM